MKTTNISKTKPNKTKAWFTLPFTPSSQEMNPAYCTAPRTRMGLDIVGTAFFTVPVNQRGCPEKRVVKGLLLLLAHKLGQVVKED